MLRFFAIPATLIVLSASLFACGSTADPEVLSEPVPPQPPADPWAKQVSGTEQSWAADAAIATDDRVLVTGGYVGTATFEEGSEAEVLLEATVCDAFLASYSVEGELGWVRSIVGGSYAMVSRVGTDAAGCTVIAGYFESSVILGPGGDDEVTLSGPGMENSFLARLDPQGRILWARLLESDSWAEASALAVHPDGVITVAGSFDGTLTFWGQGLESVALEATGVADVFIAQYDTEGEVRWARSVVATPDGYAVAWALAPYTDGGSVLVGELLGAATFGADEAEESILASAEGSAGDPFLARYDVTGRLVWARTLASTGYAYAYAVDTAEDGCIRIGGGFTGTLTLGEGEAAVVLTSKGGTDGFMAGWKGDATFSCAVQIGGERYDDVGDLRVLKDGTAYLMGTFSGGATVERDGLVEDELVSAGGRDTFLVACDAEVCVQHVLAMGGGGRDTGYGVDVWPDGRVLLTGSFEATMVIDEPDPIVLESSGDPDAFIVRLSLDDAPETPEAPETE